MSELFYSEDTPQRIYWDRKFYTDFVEQVEALQGSSTLYVGNLSFFTSELQIQETFSRVGPIKRIIMGLNKESKTPCGFCFVQYFTHEHARECLKFISGTMCDDRVIRCELDGGFKPGRQFGRGASGGQIRDERRENIDLGRGGVLKKQDAPRKRRDFTRAAGEDRNKDLFGRDRERSRAPAPVPDLSSSLPSARREPSSAAATAPSAPQENSEDKARRSDDEEDDEGDRPRKNPRFRERDEDDEQDNED